MEQQSVTELFPVHKESVNLAFNALAVRENPQGSTMTLIQELFEIGTENRHLFGTIARTARSQPEQSGNDLLWGTVFCYRTLREEAILREGVLPKLIEEFPNDYFSERGTKVVSPNADTIEAQQQQHRLNILRFEHLEPGFSRIVQKRLDIKDSILVRAENYVYAGIIKVYFIFREALFNPTKD